MYLLSCPPETVYKKDGQEIDYFNKFRALHLSWSGYVNSEVYMRVFGEMLRLSKNHQVENWLIDARDVDFMELGENEWTRNFFSLEVLQFPLRKVARLASGNFENEAYISGFITSVLKGKKLTL